MCIEGTKAVNYARRLHSIVFQEAKEPKQKASTKRVENEEHLVRGRLQLELGGQVRAEHPGLQRLYLAANVGLALQQVPAEHGLHRCSVLVGRHHIGLPGHQQSH